MLLPRLSYINQVRQEVSQVKAQKISSIRSKSKRDLLKPHSLLPTTSPINSPEPSNSGLLHYIAPNAELINSNAPIIEKRLSGKAQIKSDWKITGACLAEADEAVKNSNEVPIVLLSAD